MVTWTRCAPHVCKISLLQRQPESTVIGRVEQDPAAGKKDMSMGNCLSYNTMPAAAKSDWVQSSQVPVR
jgi:hypothetical protein